MNENGVDSMPPEYTQVELQQRGNGLYSVFNPAYLFAIQQRQRALLRVFREQGIQSLKGKRVLEVGCGTGGVLQEYHYLGIRPGELFGIDLLFDRLQEAHQKLPNTGIDCADGQHLPFPENSFDLVLQYTAFSSVMDDSIRQQMARDMLRVLKPNGLILWYDFWLNPTNKHTLGIRPMQIRQLFQGCSIQCHKITLAPPIARRVVPVSWGLGLFLESLEFLNTHYLAVIQKDSLQNEE